MASQQACQLIRPHSATRARLQEALEAADSGSDWDGEGDRDEGGRRKKRRVYSDRKGLEAQRADWLLAEPGTVLKGTPLRCTLCDGTLLLNSRAPPWPQGLQLCTAAFAGHT